MPTLTKLPTKRLILDYSQNQNLADILFGLENYYSGLSKAEITKIALIELFRNKIPTQTIITQLTDEEEDSLSQSMKGKSKNSFQTLKNKQDITNLVNSL